MKIKLFCSCITILILTGCATTNTFKQETWPTQAQIPAFFADGRLAVKANEKGSYANFDWTYQHQVQTININTPLGNTLGQLCQDGQGVLAVDSKGAVYQAATADELSQQLLGFELPIQYLHIWANGKRVADTPYQIDSNGRLKQLGWTISRTLNKEGQLHTLLLESSELTLRLVLDEITHQPEETHSTYCTARK